MTTPAAQPFDLAAFLADVKRPENYIWREIEREGEDADGKPTPPLRIKVLDVTTAQTEAIPWGAQVPLAESYEAIAPYVVAWNLEAENLKTGETIPVPPPAEAGPGVFEILTNAEGTAIVNWIKVPQFMKAQQDAEKKSSTPSTTTSRRPKRNA